MPRKTPLEHTVYKTVARAAQTTGSEEFHKTRQIHSELMAATPVSQTIPLLQQGMVTQLTISYNCLDPEIMCKR